MKVDEKGGRGRENKKSTRRSGGEGGVRRGEEVNYAFWTLVDVASGDLAAHLRISK